MKTSLPPTGSMLSFTQFAGRISSSLFSTTGLLSSVAWYRMATASLPAIPVMPRPLSNARWTTSYSAVRSASDSIATDMLRR